MESIAKVFFNFHINSTSGFLNSTVEKYYYINANIEKAISKYSIKRTKVR